MKQIIVDVSGLSAEEKQRVNEALAKITGLNKLTSDLDMANWMYAPSTYQDDQITYSEGKNKESTHTPQQVLEMAGMETSTDQHVFLVDKFIITDSSGRIVYDSTPDSLNNFIKQRASAGKDGSLPNSDFSVKTDENGVAVMVTKQGHIHSHLMAMYAEDAKITDKPWELWQLRSDNGSVWVNCDYHPAWSNIYKYRRKPKMKLIHGVEVPDISFTPVEYQYYCLPLLAEHFFTHKCYRDCRYEEFIAKNGLCYPNTEEGKQAAILHAKAMLGIA